MTKFTLNSVGFKAETRDMILEIKEKTMEEKIKDLEEQIEIIQERLVELKETEKAERPKRWRAEEGEMYYVIDDFCNIGYAIEGFRMQDNKRYEIGNYFKTKEEAQKRFEHMITEQQLKDIALRLNKDEKI